MKTVRGDVVYKVRHVPSGKWLARSFGTAPWSLVKRGGRIFTHPKYVDSMFTQKVERSGLTADQLIRWGLGRVEDYEVVPFIMIEDTAKIQDLSVPDFEN